MFLKEKCCGKIKGWGCADGHKQQVYKTKDYASAPTIYVEYIFLLCMLNTKESCYTVTCAIPGAFMWVDINELIHLRLDGELAELLIQVDPSYHKFLTCEGKTPVIYTQISKGLNGTQQSALLFWHKLQGFLVDQLGFTPNPYDQCVENKIIQGKQCTVGWHVDDIMVYDQICKQQWNFSQLMNNILMKMIGKSSDVVYITSGTLVLFPLSSHVICPTLDRSQNYAFIWHLVAFHFICITFAFHLHFA